MEEEIKNKTTKKIVIIVLTIVIILMFVIGSIIGVVGYNIYQVALLLEETNYIVENVDLTKDTINVENLKTTGKYSKVEKALKSYLNEAAISMQNLLSAIDKDKLSNILTIENYKNDGPDFNKTTTYIQDTIKKLDENTPLALKCLEEEEIYNYIEKEDLSKYYKELYKNLMFDNKTRRELKEVKEELELVINELKTVLNKSLEIINFLKENQNDWEIQGNDIVFYSEKALDKYNELINEL